MKQILALAAAALAAVVLSARGSSHPVAAHYRGGADSLTFVAAAPSTGLGVDNIDLFSSTPSGRIRNATSTAAAETNAAWSLDGRHVIFDRQWIAGTAEREGVFVWTPGGGEPRKVIDCPGDLCFDRDFVWSPDGSKIAFATTQGDTGIKVMNADGSGLHTVCDAKCGPGLEEAAWSPNGRRLAFSNAFMVNASYFTRPISSIWVANTDGSGVRQITQPGCDSSKDAMEGCFFDSAPEWSPDGSEIAFSRLGAAENLEIVHPDGSHLRALATCRPHKEGCSIDPSWSPAGDEIAWAGRKQIEITTLSGVTSTLSTCAGSSCPDPYKPKWSPNGQEFLFFTGPEYFGTTVWTIRRDGSGLRRVARDTQCCTAWIAHAALPGRVPDPTTAGHAALHLAGTLAFSDYLPTKRHRALGLLSLSTGRTHVIHPPARRSNGWPSWSADGRKLVVAATDEWEDNYYFYVVNRDGSHVRDLLHLRSAHGAKGEMALSPDGKRIAFTTRDGIELIRPGGDPRHARRLFKFPKHFRSASEPAWSPNGRELVFSRAPKGDPNDALYTIRADGTRLTRLTNLAGDQSHPVWSPNGREIAFDWWTSAGDGVYLIRPDGTHLRRLTTQAIPTAVRPAWSPDGRYLVFFPNTGGRTKTPIDIVDAKTGRVTVLRTTIYGQAEAPSWSPY